jgi:mycothiol S-conjugate amidase
LEIQQAAHPSEDYELVRTRVPVALPETDLFAGVIPGQPLGAWLTRADRS